MFKTMLRNIYLYAGLAYRHIAIDEAILCDLPYGSLRLVKLD